MQYENTLVSTPFDEYPHLCCTCKHFWPADHWEPHALCCLEDHPTGEDDTCPKWESNP